MDGLGFIYFHLVPGPRVGLDSPADRGHETFPYSLVVPVLKAFLLHSHWTTHPAQKEKTSGLKVSSGSKKRNGPGWMCLDKQNQGGWVGGGICPLEQYSTQKASRPPPGTATFEFTSRNREDPVLIPLPALSRLHVQLFLYPPCGPDGKLYRNIFSSLLYTDRTYTVPFFVLLCFKVLKAPFSTSTQPFCTDLTSS